MSIKPSGEKSVASEQKREKERGVALSEIRGLGRAAAAERDALCAGRARRCSMLRCSAAPSSPARFIRGAAAAASLLTPRVELRRGVRYSTCHSTPRVMQGAASRLSPLCACCAARAPAACLSASAWSVGLAQTKNDRSL
jgi:hypothetical protein